MANGAEKHRKYNRSLKGKARKHRYAISHKAKKRWSAWRRRDIIRKYAEQFSSQSGRCHYCSVALTELNASPDHKLPKSRGGTDEPTNIVLSCWICNRAKNNMTDIEYIQWLRFIKNEARLL